VKLFHFRDPGESGFDFVVMAAGLADARDVATSEAPKHVAKDHLPAVLRDIRRYSPWSSTSKASVIAIFTELDPIKSRISKEKLLELEDKAAELDEIKKAIEKAPPMRAKNFYHKDVLEAS
jgi:hypothetical protein